MSEPLSGGDVGGRGALMIRLELDVWRSDPTPLATVRLCEFLAASWRHLGPRVAIWLANEATSLHSEDVGVLLAVGRMLLAAGLLQPAKVVLLDAARRAPDDLAVFRVLGEALLRAGDFPEFERVLMHAAALRRAERAVAPAVQVPGARDPFELSFDDDDEITQSTSMEQILAAARPEIADPASDLDESGARRALGGPVVPAA